MRKEFKYKHYTIEWFRHGPSHSWFVYAPPKHIGYDHYETNVNNKNTYGLMYHNRITNGHHQEDDYGLNMSKNWIDRRRRSIKQLLINTIEQIEDEQKQNP